MKAHAHFAMLRRAMFHTNFTKKTRLLKAEGKKCCSILNSHSVSFHNSLYLLRVQM